MSAAGSTRRLVFAGASASCLFLLILGAKWAVFARYGSSMPDWDQWDAEALGVLIPWFENNNFLQALFHPHNEHRVVVTKLQSLGLTLANGQWDSRLLAVFNAVLHSAIGVGFWLAVRRWVDGPWRAAMFLLIAALFALPFAWQNILGGFHSQQYWLVGLSFAAIVVLPFARAGSAPWWLAVCAAGAALLTMGSGFLAPAVVVLVVCFRAGRKQESWRQSLPTLLVAGGLVLIGVLTRAEHPGHESLKAQSVRDFVISTVHSMEWPLREQPWSGPIMWLPWALLLAWGLRGKPGADRPGPQAIAALGGWAMLQILATSYARGVGADYPASRYMDTLAIGAFANGAALAWLATNAFTTAKARLAIGMLAIAWVVLFAAGLRRELGDTFRHHLPDARKYYNAAENHLRGFLATGDPEHLKFPDIPYPSADGLMQRLENPHLRAVMPAIVRPPLAVATAARDSGGFSENLATSVRSEEHPRAGLSPGTVPLDYVKTWGSFGTAGLTATGEWRSAPLSSPLRAWLKFETAGHVGEDGVALELRDANSDALLARVQPSKVPGDAWRAAYVPAPRTEFIIVARDASPSRWMAFGAPVEVGTLSYWAWRLSKHGVLLLWFGIGGSVLLAAAAAFALRRRESPVATADSASAMASSNFGRGA